MLFLNVYDIDEGIHLQTRDRIADQIINRPSSSKLEQYLPGGNGNSDRSMKAQCAFHCACIVNFQF